MKTTFAYIAGFIDGEGYLGLAVRKNSFKARLMISNCNLELLKHIQKIIGGYISKKSKRDGWTQGYNLTVGYLETWLPEVLPYLVGKKEKAKLLLEATKLLNERKKKTNMAGDLNLKRLQEINLLLRKKEWLI